MTTFKIPESITEDVTKDDYKAWMTIENEIPVVPKLTKTKIFQRVWKEMQNKEEDQKEVQNKIIEKPCTYKCGNEECVENFETRCTTSLEEFLKAT